MVFATSVAYIGDRWSGGTVTEVTSLYVAGTVLGGFAGRFVTGFMTEYVGWREAFALLAGLSLLIGVAIHLLLPANPPLTAPRASGGLSALRELCRRPLLAAYGVGFCVLFSQVATFTYAGLYLSQAPFDLGAAALGADLQRVPAGPGGDSQSPAPEPSSRPQAERWWPRRCSGSAVRP